MYVEVSAACTDFSQLSRISRNYGLRICLRLEAKFREMADEKKKQISMTSQRNLTIYGNIMKYQRIEKKCATGWKGKSEKTKQACPQTFSGRRLDTNSSINSFQNFIRLNSSCWGDKPDVNTIVPWHRHHARRHRSRHRHRARRNRARRHRASHRAYY